MTMLIAQYKNLDPVKLLKELQCKQEEFWKYAWTKTTKVLSQHDTNNGTAGLLAIKKDVKKAENNSLIAGINVNETLVSLEYYKHSKKHLKPLGLRTWHTRKDPFESVSQFLSTQLAINPGTTAKDLLNSLMEIYPKNFDMSHLRTLQRKIASCRNYQLRQEKDHQLKIMINQQT